MSLSINDCLCLLVRSVAQCLNGEYDLTNDNVPRIIFTCTDANDTTKSANVGMKVSVVYLANTQQWKAFYPFPAIDQTRKYFSDLIDLIDWLYAMGVDV